MSKENTIFHNLPPFNFQSEGYRLCRIECFLFFLMMMGHFSILSNSESLARIWLVANERNLAGIGSVISSLLRRSVWHKWTCRTAPSLSHGTPYGAPFLTTQWNSVSFLELLSGSAPFDQHDVRLSGPLVFIFVSGHMNDEFGLVGLSLFGLSWIWFTVTSIEFWG